MKNTTIFRFYFLLFNLFLLMAMPGRALAQNAATGFRLLEEDRVEEAAILFQGLLAADPLDVAANYGMSLVHGSVWYAGRDPFAAYEHAQTAHTYFFLLDEREERRLSEQLDAERVNLRKNIAEAELYERVLASRDSTALERFVSSCVLSRYHASATEELARRRRELAEAQERRRQESLRQEQAARAEAMDQQLEAMRALTLVLGISNNFSPEQRVAHQRWATSVWGLSMENPDALFFRASGARRQVALTFDDGPDATYTAQILDILAREGAAGSFFILGANAERHPDLVRRMHREGHLVLNHSYDHPRLTELAPWQVRDQVERAERVVERLIGLRPALFRPPYGALDQATLDAIGQTGAKTVCWSVDTFDWNQAGPRVLEIGRQARPGDVVLMHCKASTVEALPEMIRALKRSGYELVGLDELLGLPAYKPLRAR